jgi:hypothetical protein
MTLEKIKIQLDILTAEVEKLSRAHAELRAKYKTDPTLKMQYLVGVSWFDCYGSPAWDEDTQYRLKPEAKPDTVRYYSTHVHGGESTLDSVRHYYSSTGVIKVTHDGEGKLKSAEVVE